MERRVKFGFNYDENSGFQQAVFKTYYDWTLKKTSAASTHYFYLLMSSLLKANTCQSETFFLFCPKYYRDVSKGDYL